MQKLVARGDANEISLSANQCQAGAASPKIVLAHRPYLRPNHCAGLINPSNCAATRGNACVVSARIDHNGDRYAARGEHGGELAARRDMCFDPGIANADTANREATDLGA